MYYRICSILALRDYLRARGFTCERASKVVAIQDNVASCDLRRFLESDIARENDSNLKRVVLLCIHIYITTS